MNPREHTFQKQTHGVFLNTPECLSAHIYNKQGVSGIGSLHELWLLQRDHPHELVKQVNAKCKAATTILRREEAKTSCLPERRLEIEGIIIAIVTLHHFSYTYIKLTECVHACWQSSLLQTN